MSPPATKPTKVKSPAPHPPYTSMVVDAVKNLANRRGSSRQAILKYVVANNKVDAVKAPHRVKLALAKLIETKEIVPAAVAGRKGAGSFKLGKKEKVKKAKQPKAKKPAAKKVAKKSSAKKAAKKSSAKVAKKSAAKKAIQKSAGKKPVAKKMPKKSAMKKAVQK